MQKFYSPGMRIPLFLVFSCILGLSGQLFGQCDPPQQLPTGTCYTAPLTCLQDACYSTQNNPPMGEVQEWCGPNTAVHNPQYFLFQATSMNVQINIHVNSCQGGGCGLQAAIIDTCINAMPPWGLENVLSCDPGQPVGGTMMLTYNMMEIDSFYWLMIDGCGGQICEYTIEFVEGILTPGIPGELNSAGTNDPVVCQGQDMWTGFATPALPEAHGYLWTGFPWAPGYITTTYADMSGPNDPISIPDNAPPGIYEICVVAFSGCDTTDMPVCFDLEIIEIEDEESEPVTLCPEDFMSLTWQGISITGPGVYMKTFNTPEGCPYDSIKEYMSFPEPEDGQIDTVVCAENYTYENMVYDMGGTYTLQYPNGSIYGCDSIAYLNLDLIYIEPAIEFYCDAQQFVLTSMINFAIPTQSGLSYEWFWNGDLWCQDASCTSPYDGTFELFVSYTIDGVTCTYEAEGSPLTITLADLVPDPPMLESYSPVACALDYPVYSVVEDDDIEVYTWTVQPSGVPLFPNGSNDSEIEVNWQGFTGGTICVTGTNACGEGEPTCFDITVIPSPIADFNMPSAACVDSAVTITFTGTASQDAMFLWDFGTGATIISGGTGAGPHVVSWGSPGTQTVTLQVAEMGCDTSDISFDIQIETLGQPVVSCSSTLNSVTFEWDPVTGASLPYTVTVLQGPAGMIVADTSYVVTGLAPGTVVEITVTVNGLGACAQQSATAQCIAQSCPPKMIMIQIPNDSFCLGDVMGPIALSALVDNVVTPGTWSGPGVDPAGTFDPVLAGVGQHQILYMLMEGTCSYQRSVTVNVLDTPTSTFTLDAALCQTDDAVVQYTGTASAGANYQWNFGTATVVSGSGAGPYTLHWNTTGMKTVTLTVEQNGCSSTSESHMIDVQPALTAPIVQCFPTTSTVALQWSMVPNATMYDVTHLFGPMGTVNGNRYEVSGLTPGDSISIEITVSGAGLCPPVTVQASCVAQDCPMPTFVLTPVNDICLYPGTQTEALQVMVSNGNGTGSWSGPGVTDPTGVFDPLVAGPGSHVVAYNYMDAGCSFVETITIDVFDPPMADISNSDLTLTCDNGNQLVLDGSTSTGPGALVYTWSTTNGSILGPSDQPTVTVGAKGDYDLLVTDPLSGCEDMVGVTVMQDDGIPNADAGPDKLLNCNIQFTVIGGNSSSGPSISYVWSTIEGVIDSDPTAPTVTVSEPGIYDLVVTDMSNGCSAMDQVTVSLNDTPPSGVVTVGDILDCDTETTTITADIMPMPGGFTYEWVTTAGQIQSGANTSEATVSRAGIYTLYVTSIDNGCADTLSVEVLADDGVISALETTVDNPDCVGDVNGSVSIDLVTGGMAPYAYVWSTGSTADALTNLGPGNYAVTVSDANGCKYTESFVLPAPVAMNPDIGPQIRVNEGEDVVITLTVADSAAVQEIIWDGAPACAGCFTNTFIGTESTDVVVTVIDTNGCEASASLRLTVFRPRKVFIPNVFSPNGDGFNDYFFIDGNTIVEIRNLTIYDRWGGLVFGVASIAPGADAWDGRFGGKDVNPGVYVYRAEVVHDDGIYIEVVTGDITLVR